MHTTELRDPNTLRRHPLHKEHVPPPDKKSIEWKGFVDEVHADGKIRVPLMITSTGLVMDGWWRREAGNDLQFLTVPCQICDPNEAALLIVQPLTAHKAMDRGAAVYLSLGLLPEYVDAVERRRLRNKTANITTTEERIDPRSTTSGASNVYLASRWGCGEKTVRDARKVRSTLHDPKVFLQWIASDEYPGLRLPPAHPMRVKPAEAQAALREEFEPLLYKGAHSLWTILPAVAGRVTGKRNEPAKEQMTLIHDSLLKLNKHFLKLPEHGREAWIKKLPFELQDIDLDLLDILEEAIPKARAKQERKEA